MEIIVKQIREELKISLEQLEDDTGIKRSRLAEIENNEVEVEKILFGEMFLIAESLRKEDRRIVRSRMH